MRKYLLAGAAALIIATPAMARDNSGYVGIEGGVLFPKKQNINASTDFTDPLVTDVLDTRVASFKSKTGYDIDAIAGYDFGMFRLEGELGYKRAKLKSGSINSAFLTSLNTGSGDIFIDDDFDLGGRTSVLSGMVNGLLDFGDDNGISGSIGAGIGRARVKQFGTGSGGTVFFDNSSKFSSHSLLASLIFNLGTAEVMAPPPPPPMAPAPEPMAPQTQTCPDGSVILATSACALPPPPPPPPAAPVERGERGQ